MKNKKKLKKIKKKKAETKHTELDKCSSTWGMGSRTKNKLRNRGTAKRAHDRHASIYDIVSWEMRGRRSWIDVRKLDEALDPAAVQDDCHRGAT